MSQVPAETIARWVRQNATPLDSAFDVPLTKLDVLHRRLNDATVVGLGESSHGTAEFFHLRHQLLRHLVTDCGFTRFAAEISYGATDAVNAYIRGGDTTLATALRATGHPMWNVSEFAQ